MFSKRFQILRLFGFPIYLDLSWFLIVLLIVWSLATGVFPHQFEDLSPWIYWVMGTCGALGLFASILLHELGHAVVARRFGLDIRGITLFIFGGVAEMSDQPPSAKAEFWVAVAGPFVSIIIAAVCLSVWMAGSLAGLPAAINGVFAWLGIINIVLVAFNMIPAFPLDGGRVFRSLLWHLKGDLTWATRITSSVGSFFGLALIAMGIVFFFMGDPIGGIWWFLIGLFLRNAASMSYQQLIMRRALEGEPVARFMRREPVTVDPNITIQELVDNYLYRHQHKLYPVMEDGRLAGCVTLRDVQNVPREEWNRRSVADIAGACSDENTILDSEDALSALSKLNATGASRLMVVDEQGDLVGIVALKDLMGFLSMKIDLETRR